MNSLFAPLIPSRSEKYQQSSNINNIITNMTSVLPLYRFSHVRAILHREIRNLPVLLSLQLLQIDRIVSNAPDPLECTSSARLHITSSRHYVRFFAESEFVRISKRARIKDRANLSRIYQVPPRCVYRYCALRNSSSHSLDWTVKQYETKSLIRNSLFRQKWNNMRKNVNQKIFCKYMKMYKGNSNRYKFH